MDSLIRRLIVAGAISLSISPAQLRAQTPAFADSAFRRSDWPAATAGYERITAQQPTNGMAWFRLGISYAALAQYPKALVALSHAKTLGFQPASVRYRMARAYARESDPAHAFELLDSAVAVAPGGFTPKTIDAEPDLVSLHGDARYKKFTDALALTRYPCRTSKEAQQFDFWIGQWDVTAWSGVIMPGSQPGFNDVHPILEHCIVFENWKGPSGGEGKSFNYFDTNLNKWRQIWMDDSGSALDYTGEFRDGAMRFTGWTLDSQGHRVEQKLTFTPIDSNTVRQTFEASSDAGKTWAVTFDGRYVRRKSCLADSVYHVLDFWVGTWNVVDSSGAAAGSSNIERIVGGCAIMENWREPDGSEGKSLFYYATDQRRWKQVWVTPAAMLPGGYKEKRLVARLPGGGVRFQGEIVGNTSVVLDRTSLMPMPQGKVRQVIEISRNGGTTWETTFDAIYIPVKAKPN